jgi:hypothetical protein
MNHDARCDEALAEDRDAKELVIAEYAADGRLLVDDTDEVLLLRTDWRLRTTQLSQRPPVALHRPRQPRS